MTGETMDETTFYRAAGELLDILKTLPNDASRKRVLDKVERHFGDRRATRKEIFEVARRALIVEERRVSKRIGGLNERLAYERKRAPPWEHNRPVVGFAADASDLPPLINEAFWSAAENVRYPHVDPKTRRFNFGEVQVGQIGKSDHTMTFEGPRELQPLLERLCAILNEAPAPVYAGASVYGHFLRSIRDGSLRRPDSDKRFSEQFMRMVDTLDTLTPFVVNHDWKRVLKLAGESGEGGELPALPNADATVFEYAFPGLRLVVIACALEEQNDIGTTMFARVDKQWFSLGADRFRQPRAHPEDKFYMELQYQIRATCIMLEARVAETQIIRSDYKRNERRERHGQVKFFDYHIVNLAARHRVERSDIRANDEKRTSPRLHFVRSHDRYYDNYSVRIPWFYRGDADLGFIDKEYRL